MRRAFHTERLERLGHVGRRPARVARLTTRRVGALMADVAGTRRFAGAAGAGAAAVYGSISAA
jgi:hypothetical protein